VYNGENYLALALESILAQTFQDFELIICDNASTDRTEEIARQYAQRDQRIRYHRNETNIGGARNHNLVIELARGRYVKLAAHDDLIAPTFLEECVAQMEQHPEAVICFTGTIVIDEEGKEVQTYQSTRGTAARPSQRFMQLAFRTHNCDADYGVMRAEVLKKAEPHGNYIDADKVFLSGLAMAGPFLAVHKPLFYKRFHPKNYVLNWRDRMAWFNPDRKGKISLPNWLELGGFIRVVARAKVPLHERVLCAGVAALWTLRYSPQLANDVFVAGRVAVSRLRPNSSQQGIYNWE
jgi:glycosyltransferase involved in cell wall biosynthesis